MAAEQAERLRAEELRRHVAPRGEARGVRARGIDVVELRQPADEVLGEADVALEVPGVLIPAVDLPEAPLLARARARSNHDGALGLCDGEERVELIRLLGGRIAGGPVEVDEQRRRARAVVRRRDVEVIAAIVHVVAEREDLLVQRAGGRPARAALPVEAERAVATRELGARGAAARAAGSVPGPLPSRSARRATRAAGPGRQRLGVVGAGRDQRREGEQEERPAHTVRVARSARARTSKSIHRAQRARGGTENVRRARGSVSPAAAPAQSPTCGARRASRRTTSRGSARP
jgi:hypothetical protein